MSGANGASRGGGPSGPSRASRSELKAVELPGSSSIRYDNLSSGRGLVVKISLAGSSNRLNQEEATDWWAQSRENGVSRATLRRLRWLLRSPKYLILWLVATLLVVTGLVPRSASE